MVAVPTSTTMLLGSRSIAFHSHPPAPRPRQKLALHVRGDTGFPSRPAQAGHTSELKQIQGHAGGTAGKARHGVEHTGDDGQTEGRSA